MPEPVIDIVIPVYNEEKVIRKTVTEILGYAHRNILQSFIVTIANNASTDGTAQIGAELSEEFPEVRIVNIPRKGRGFALKQVWSDSPADVLCYMDADLSTDIRHLPELLNPIINNEKDLMIGSRLLPESITDRGIKRETISRGYNLILKFSLKLCVKDAQCGFKAISRSAAVKLLPKVEDNEWFFDTELLYYAQRDGYRIGEIGVKWDEDLDTTVKIFQTAKDDLKGIKRLIKNRKKDGRIVETKIYEEIQ